MANLTDVLNQKPFKERMCSAELTEGIHNQLMSLAVLCILLSVTAFLGNALILVAFHKESSLHPPSKLLYRSLATTDLCVGILADPLVVTYFMSVINQRWNICFFAFVALHITGYVLCSVSLFTMTAISVDRLLALLLGLRYRQVVTLKRVYLAATGFWVVSILGTATYFWSYVINLWFGYVGICMCLSISITSYSKIFLILRHHQIQIHQEQPVQSIPLNIARYRKAVSNAMWVQFTLVVCYLPFGIVEFFVLHKGLSESIYLARWITATLVLLNSSLNPLLYCWKIREVRHAVKDIIRQLCCSSG